MKINFTLILLVFIGMQPSFGQLNTLHNCFRAGDVLIKQQVEFVDPGSAGINQIWDFSNLETIDDEYTITYSHPPLEGDSVYILGNIRYNKKKISDNELLVGTEHNTKYYYHLLNDSLLQTGHENISVKVEYIDPIVLIKFPLNYGQAITSRYKSKGLYSGAIITQFEGTSTISADAFGKIVLPSNDTISPVLRIKIEQTVQSVPSELFYDDTRKEEDDSEKLLEIYRWYYKGYRYPIIETVKNINISDGATIFSTAFFYPPQDHLYVDTNFDDQTLLDELWTKIERTNLSSISRHESKMISLQDIMICRIYPNPVNTHLNFEYELKGNAKVSFELYSIKGILVKKTTPKYKTKGLYYETIDCSNLIAKNYILRIIANDTFVNEIIIKE